MRSWRVTWTRVVCAILVVLVASMGVAACTSDPAKPPPVSVTSPAANTSTVPVVTTPPSTPAPTVPADVPRTGRNLRAGEQPPVMPVLATTHSDAGAKAFVTFFMQTWDWGYATTSGAYMRHYFAAGCTLCRTIAENFDRSRGKQYYILGERLVSMVVAPDAGAATRPGSEAAWTTTFGQTAGGAYDANTRLVRGGPESKGHKATAYVSWSRGWAVTWLVLS